MAAGVEAMQWRVVSAFECLSQQWDEEVVLFHSGTGNTHLLENKAYQIIRILQQAPDNTTGLIQSLSVHLPLLDQETLAAYVPRALKELQRLDIVETVET